MGRQNGSSNKQAAKNKQFILSLDKVGLDVNQIQETTSFSRTWIYEMLREAAKEEQQ